MKNVHAIEAASNEEEQEEAKPPCFEQPHKDGVFPVEHTKKFPLCEDVPDRTVTIGKGLEKNRRSQIDTVLAKQSGRLRMVIFGPARSQQRNHGT